MFESNRSLGAARNRSGGDLGIIAEKGADGYLAFASKLGLRTQRQLDHALQ
jgi:hypothetical protein